MSFIQTNIQYDLPLTQHDYDKCKDTKNVKHYMFQSFPCHYNGLFSDFFGEESVG